MGWSQNEIAQSLDLDPSAISKAIEKMRNRRGSTSTSARKRYDCLLQEMADRASLAQREGWRLYHDTSLSERERNLRATVLGKVIGGLSIIGRFAGDLETMRFEEQLEELRRQHEQIRGMIEEARQKGKISE